MKKTVLTMTKSIFEVERSVFHAYLYPLQSEEDFKPLLKKLQKEHPKAAHICYAYRCKNRQKCSDDGEPAKTAGYPMMSVLEHHHLDEIALFVVRYFGGIKLGTGGLVRAYTQSALQVISEAKLYEIVSLQTYHLLFHPTYIQLIDRYLLQNNIHVISKDFGVNVTYHIATNQSIDIDLIELTHNQITIKIIGEQIFYQ